ncbi:hypothetical protein MKW92_007703 [Papaver armeniacum]|nr:hypothetical protein MKW92_007703 [Papaver armeniacum]
MSSFNASKMIVALALCLLLLGGFSVGGARTINADCHYYSDCTRHCRVRIARLFPWIVSSKVDQETIHVDYDMPGDYCCLH